MPILKNSEGQILFKDEAIIKGSVANWASDIACCCGQRYSCLLMYRATYNCETASWELTNYFSSAIITLEEFETDWQEQLTDHWGQENTWNIGPIDLDTTYKEYIEYYEGEGVIDVGPCIAIWWGYGCCAWDIPESPEPPPEEEEY
jgi:hypothetical protein